MSDTYAPRHDQDAAILSDTPSAEADVPFTYRKIAPPRAALLPLELRVLAEGAALAAYCAHCPSHGSHSPCLR